MIKTIYANHLLVCGTRRQQAPYLIEINFDTILPLTITSTARTFHQS